jgi:hypothetical protein
MLRSLESHPFHGRDTRDHERRGMAKRLAARLPNRHLAAQLSFQSRPEHRAYRLMADANFSSNGAQGQAVARQVPDAFDRFG